MATLVVVGYTVLFYILYSNLGAVVQQSHENLFVEKVRTFSRLMADQLEVGGVIESPKLTTDLLELRRAGLERQLQHRERVETVGTLAGGIAHEFNNILVPIILLSELVLKRLPAESGSKKDVASVLAAALRARDLVKQILAFSHDISELVIEPVDLRDTVDEALKLFRPLILPNCQLVIRSGAQVRVVQASRSLTVQLVVNLCKNAYQSLAGAAGVVTVRVEDLDIAEARPGGAPAGRYVELTVQDTGAGMDTATIARIFEPFYTTRSVGEGTGLGLSVVHGIAESFGARILVTSAPGLGSTFRVLFPAAA